MALHHKLVVQCMVLMLGYREEGSEHLQAVGRALDAANARDAGKDIDRHVYRHGPTRPKYFTVFTDQTEYAYPLERERYLEATSRWLRYCDESVPPPPVPYQDGAWLDMSHVMRIEEWIGKNKPLRSRLGHLVKKRITIEELSRIEVSLAEEVKLNKTVRISRELQTLLPRLLVQLNLANCQRGLQFDESMLVRYAIWMLSSAIDPDAPLPDWVKLTAIDAT